MKCPKCGFVSFPERADCKKCGHRFAPTEGSRPSVRGDSPSFQSRDKPFSSPLVSASFSSATDSLLAPGQDDVPVSSKSPSPGPAASVANDSSVSGEPSADERANAWEDEIAERVARYRRQRGRPQSAVTDSNLEFEFKPELSDEAGSGGEDDIDTESGVGGQAARSAAARGGLDSVLDWRGSEAASPSLDSIPLARLTEARLQAEEAAEWTLEPRDLHEPVEIVLDSGPGPEEEEEDEPEIAGSSRMPRAAPIGPRLAAGLVDALVLLAAACIFGLVFWKSGGHVSLSRQSSDVMTMVMLGLAAAFFLAFYFGLFTALAFATPGQSAMGLRVRTLDGRPPDWPAARRRALGYLVSMGALMLGFVWAVFDPEGLSWHDRISGTCLIEQD
ncbi:MAG TPA: RDD family protein [Terriglobia bacterium]